MSRKRSFLAAAAATVGAAALLWSAPAGADTVIEAIYTKIPGHPTAIVPGALDENGNPMVVEFRQFDQLTVSRNGAWVLRAQNQQISDPDLRSVVLIGAGDSGTTVFQRGLPFPGAVGSEVFNFSQGGAGFNDNDDFAIRIRAMGGDNSIFQKVMQSIGGQFSVAFQMGDPYSGLEGPSGTPQAGFVGNSINSTHLLNNGMIGTHDNTVTVLPSLYRPVLAYDLQKFMQRNVDTVIGLNGFGVELIAGLVGDQFFSTPNSIPFDGSNPGSWIARGQIDQPNNQNVVIVDRQLVMRQGHAVPGTNVVVDALHNVAILSNGDWYVRGNQAGDAGALAVRNGVVIAKVDDAVGDERWAGTSFSSFTGNNNGDWVIAGQTDNPDTAKNFVIVVNGEIVVREGDEVSVDGVDAFLGMSNGSSPFGPDSVYLTDDNVLYFLGALNDGQGNDYNGNPSFGQPRALLRIDLGDPGVPCPADLTGSGSVGVPDLLALLACWGPVQPGCENADLTGSGSVGVPDLLDLLAQWGPCP